MRALQNITCDVEEIDASYVNEAMVSGLSSPEDVIASHIVCRVAKCQCHVLGFTHENVSDCDECSCRIA